MPLSFVLISDFRFLIWVLGAVIRNYYSSSHESEYKE